MIPKRWINSQNRKKSTLLKRLSKLKNDEGKKEMLETMPISEKLKMLRDRRGLTLDELAERTGLSRSALSNYETNESKEVSQFALVTLAKFYGVSTDYLLDPHFRNPNILPKRKNGYFSLDYRKQ